MATLCWSSREEIPHVQGKRNPSKTVGVATGHQRANTLKPYSQKTSQSHHTRTTALSNLMKLSHAMGQPNGWVMVERSDRTWSTGEGNGKPLQYSCLENPMNSTKSFQVTSPQKASAVTVFLSGSLSSFYVCVCVTSNISRGHREDGGCRWPHDWKDRCLFTRLTGGRQEGSRAL